MRDDKYADIGILVGVDGSTSSVRALRWALKEAEATGRRITALRVLDLATDTGMAMTVPRTSDIVAEAKAALDDTVHRAAFGEPRVPLQTRVEHGHPAAVLIDYSEHADLLVVGRRGRGGFATALLGAVSQYCVHHARCPVVVIPSPPETGPGELAAEGRA
ncbi:universal stress protein [Glycomyces sp. NPDC049804]|uniref:universal stress protein n=1 Tax=Glycomyces sp. NPDC049804 TaxID=3154363 RepID=UPI003419661E